MSIIIIIIKLMRLEPTNLFNVMVFDQIVAIHNCVNIFTLYLNLYNPHMLATCINYEAHDQVTISCLCSLCMESSSKNCCVCLEIKVRIYTKQNVGCLLVMNCISVVTRSDYNTSFCESYIKDQVLSSITQSMWHSTLKP